MTPMGIAKQASKMDEIMDQETMDQLVIVMDKICDFYKEALKVPEFASLIKGH